MTPKLLEGRSVAASLEDELRARIAELVRRGGRTPGLATMVGDDPALASYAKSKAVACRRVGIEPLPVHLSGETITEQLASRIEALNADPAVQGILVEHPLPPGIDARACFDRVAIEKDVDGVTALGFGRVATGERAYGSSIALRSCVCKHTTESRSPSGTPSSSGRARRWAGPWP